MPADTAPLSAAARATWSAMDAGGMLLGATAAMSVRIDLRHPEAGLSVVRPGRVPESGDRGMTPPEGVGESDRLLGLDLRGPARLVDHWIRGTDLSAIYEQGDGRSLRATAMWRALGVEIAAPADLQAWEVIVSAQTALLHSEAGLAVACDLHAERVAWGTLATCAAGGRVAWSAIANERWSPHARAVLMRRPAVATAAATSVVVAVHGDDGLGISARLADTRARIECRLFGDVLEKGVLLRSRVLAAEGPAMDDTVWADRLVRAYVALPPMLDT